MWFKPRPNVTLKHGRIQKQMLHSNVCQPMIKLDRINVEPPIYLIELEFRLMNVFDIVYLAGFLCDLQFRSLKFQFKISRPKS